MVEDVQDRETERERERDPDDATFEKKKNNGRDKHSGKALSAQKRR